MVWARMGSSLKRANNNQNGEQREIKKPRLDSLHPHIFLTHFNQNALPMRATTDGVRLYYKAQLDKPEATVYECKSLLAH